MWRLLEDPQISHAYANFLIAAGRNEGRHEGPPWHDGDLYKWLEAVAAVYAVTKDEQLDRLMDDLIELIGSVQRDDGYIHTPTLIRQRQAGGVQEFEDRLHFETYNMGHLMTAACIHHRATGKDSFLDIARKAADYLRRFYEEAAPELARNAICPSHYMGVIELYRTTRDHTYLELGRNLIEIRDLVTDGSDDNQDRVPLRQQTRAVGHAVRANYLHAGIADVYAETGQADLLATLEALWTSVVEQKMYITGGCGALFDGASPDGSPDEDVIARTQQAYGREYQLPNVTAYNETCASVGNALWNWRMLAITGDARFADVLELVLYNGILGSIGLDGKSYFYTNTLRRLNDLPFELRSPGNNWPKPGTTDSGTPDAGTRMRQAYIGCFCCPPNVVRTIAEVHNYAYSLSDGAVWINLYGSSVLDTTLADGSRLRLTQETDYPWDGRVTLAVDSITTSPLDLMLRIPGWARNATVSINGKPVDDIIEPGTYLRLARIWSKDDRIELTLPMNARLIESHPMVEENRNQVAVMRGPLVYCLESVDLPVGTDITEIVIPRDIQLRSRNDRALGDALDGVTVLEGRARIPSGRPHRAHSLYQEVSDSSLQDIDIRLVPYYAWGNRGEYEMTVWMPMTW
jgi:DUF1680 family protein